MVPAFEGAVTVIAADSNDVELPHPPVTTQ